MKIRAKILLFTSTFLIGLVVMNTVVSVRNIQQQGDERLAAYRDEAVDGVKNHLKDLVDVAYETIDSEYENLSDLDYLASFYERRLDAIIDSGEAIVNKYKRQVAQGSLSLAAAQQAALDEIRELRFDGGTGYIWINDLGKPFPRMIMHPTVPSTDGKILDDPQYNTAQGTDRNLFQAFVDVTEDDNEGYVDYMWPKPTADGVTDEWVPKLSYVRRYNDWGWILGTGIYIDDATRDIENKIIQVVKQMRYDNGTGYFWINDDTLPFPTMIMHPTVPDLDGQVLDDPQFDNALGVDKNLFQAFAEVTAASPSDDGFVDYLWPKPTPEGLTPRVPKMSYVRLHEPTGWIIGSGAYIDNIDAIVAEQEAQIEGQISGLIRNNLIVSIAFIAVALGVCWVFSGTLSKPIRNLTGIAEEISKGKNLSAIINEKMRADEIGDLAKSIDRLKNSVNVMLQRLKKAA